MKCLVCGKTIRTGDQYIVVHSDDRSISKQGRVHLRCVATAITAEHRDASVTLPAGAKVTRTDQMFHRLWTRAVGQPGYDKAEWQALRWLMQGGGKQGEPPASVAVGQAIARLNTPIGLEAP